MFLDVQTTTGLSLIAQTISPIIQTTTTPSTTNKNIPGYSILLNCVYSYFLK